MAHSRESATKVSKSAKGVKGLTPPVFQGELATKLPEMFLKMPPWGFARLHPTHLSLLA